jgi:hypothetical protein
MRSMVERANVFGGSFPADAPSTAPRRGPPPPLTQGRKSKSVLAARFLFRVRVLLTTRMTPKSGVRFSEEVMRTTA